MTTFNLRTLKLRPGEGYRDTLPLELEPFELGGERYVLVPERQAAALSIARTSSGMVLELAFQADLAGPCFRCLDEAAVRLSVRAREYHEPGAASEELRTPYVDEGRLDLARWARDALALELPGKILCKEECTGLCAGCGANLNAGSCSCQPPAPDPRLSQLAELRDRL